MNTGYVYAFFGGLLALGLALPALLLAWSVLLPGMVARARIQLEQAPRRSVAIGAASFLLALLVTGMPAARPLGWLVLLGLLAATTIGGAGLAALMGDRLATRASGPTALLRGAVTLELAALVPFVGWFVLVPLGSLAALGAALHALFRRRSLPVAAEAAHATPTP